MLNRTQMALSAVFKWAAIRQRAGIIANPVAPLPRRFTEHGRKRVLTMDEIHRVLLDIQGREVGAPTALKLALLTAQRSGEVAAMEWSQIDGSTWRMPVGFRKRVRGQQEAPAHEVHLSGAALAVLEEARALKGRRYVFPSEGKAGHLQPNGLSQAALRIRQALEMERWTPHDLRRTAATRMIELGHSRLVVDKILGHKDASVAGIYDRHDYWEEQVEALEEWGSRIAEFGEAKPRTA
jgi:integrase